MFSGRLHHLPNDTAPFLTDWRKRYIGRALAVAQPDSVGDVAAVVRWCADQRVPLVPQGGNTGLSGGATPDESGRALVLSLARLNRVRAIDTANNSMTVEAGCVLADVQRQAADAGRLFPLSLAAEGSCTIGGNLSTNAGGVQVLRFGNARELCLGLEVVTASGEIWDGLRGLRKDNTGYDLRDLFIGAEGTLGVITAATLKLHPLPAAQVTALVALNDPDAAVALLERAQRRLGASLTAFELMSAFCIDLVLRHFPDCRLPFGELASPYYVLLECSDADSHEHAQAALTALLAEALEHTLISDAAVASSIAQSRAIWALRENISEAQAAEGKNIKHDVSVPISAIAEFVAHTNAALTTRFPGVRMVVFGHLGDGNLHYNVSPPEGATDEAAFLAMQPDINRLTHDAVVARRGSISAEHGLGQLRRDEAARYKSPVEMSLMRAIKQALDPLGIMNPNKVLGPSG
ncbi:MAG: FAD-binding oxidoreductase [Betaproteobacteria bacterium]|nr:FAD-binding oxidoreductase [Betaproteobacteria bacterium]